MYTKYTYFADVPVLLKMTGTLVLCEEETDRQTDRQVINRRHQICRVAREHSERSEHSEHRRSTHSFTLTKTGDTCTQVFQDTRFSLTQLSLLLLLLQGRDIALLPLLKLTLSMS